MDISVEVCNDRDFIISVLLDDWSAASNDGCTVEDLNFDDGSLWLHIEADGERIGVWQLCARTNICLNLHCYLLKAFRRKYWAFCGESLVKYVKDLPFKKLIAEIPANRRATELFASRCGFEREGVLKNAIIEDGELTDIHIYSRSIC